MSSDAQSVVLHLGHLERQMRILLIVFRSHLSASLPNNTDQKDPNIIPNMLIMTPFKRFIANREKINYSVISSNSQFSIANLFAIFLSVGSDTSAISPLNTTRIHSNFRVLNCTY